MGPNSHQDLCNLWAKVHRTFFTEGRRNRSGKISFPILDILRRSGDIPDQSRRLYKIDRNFACFWPPDFLGDRGPPNYWTWIIKLRQFPTMWPSFTAIGRGTSENAWRKNKERKKTSRAFYKSSRTTVTGGLKCRYFTLPGQNFVRFIPVSSVDRDKTIRSRLLGRLIFLPKLKQSPKRTAITHLVSKTK